MPTSAIQRGSPGAYVYVINADNTVSVRQITTGAIDGNVTAVNSGLAAGERVVIDGTDRLRDGLQCRRRRPIRPQRRPRARRQRRPTWQAASSGERRRRPQPEFRRSAVRRRASGGQ